MNSGVRLGKLYLNIGVNMVLSFGGFQELCIPMKFKAFLGNQLKLCSTNDKTKKSRKTNLLLIIFVYKRTIIGENIKQFHDYIILYTFSNEAVPRVCEYMH